MEKNTPPLGDTRKDAKIQVRLAQLRLKLRMLQRMMDRGHNMVELFALFAQAEKDLNDASDEAAAMATEFIRHILHDGDPSSN